MAGSQLTLAVPKLPELCSVPVTFSFLRKYWLFLNSAALYRFLFLLSPLARCLFSSAPVTKISSPQCVIFVSSALIICGLKAERSPLEEEETTPNPHFSFQVAGSCSPIKGGTQESLLLFASSILSPAALSCRSRQAGLGPRALQGLRAETRAALHFQIKGTAEYPDV